MRDDHMKRQQDLLRQQGQRRVRREQAKRNQDFLEAQLKRSRERRWKGGALVARHPGAPPRELDESKMVEAVIREQAQRLRQPSAAVEDVVAPLQAAVARCRATSDRAGEGLALNQLGNAYLEHGWCPEATSAFGKSRSIFFDLGDRSGEGAALWGLASAHRTQGNLDEAIRAGWQGLQLSRQVGNRYAEALTLSQLGEAHALRGRADAAMEALVGSARICAEEEAERAEFVPVKDYVEGLLSVLRESQEPPISKGRGKRRRWSIFGRRSKPSQLPG